MNERIKQLRKSLKMTQAEFGASLGVGRDTVANWELGRVIPTQIQINAICSIHNVYEPWLVDGVSAPTPTPSNEISAYLGRLVAVPEDVPEDEQWKLFEKSFIQSMAHRDKDFWIALQGLFKDFLAKLPEAAAEDKIEKDD